MFRHILKVTVLVLLMVGATAEAHDPSAYGGLFRTRDFGGVWLNADVGLFLGGAVSVAVNPADPNHLLLGTDSSLLVSRSGGRDWKREAPGKLFGAVFAVGFLPDGKAALCSTPAGIFRLDNGEWQQASASPEAAPSRAIALGAEPQRVYLLGRRDLFRSDDAGRTWTRVEHDLADRAEFTALAVAIRDIETLYAIADGRVVASQDRGASWKPRSTGLPEAIVEAMAVDARVPGRLWAASADRIYRSDNGGERWGAYGQPLPEAGTNVRGIAANDDGGTLVLTTHRGMYRSTDGALSWGLVEGNLPIHLEARPLLRDASHAGTLYAGYALMPYAEIWRIAVEGGNLLGRIDAINLAGAAAFLMLLCLGGFILTRWLIRRRDSAHEPIRKAG